MTGTSSEFEVLGLGVSTLDLMMVVDEFPTHEMVQRARQSTLQGGGPVATAMVALARLGARTAMLDKIGDDWRGKLILDEFDREGVSTSYLKVAAGRSSSIASILVRKKDGARTIVYSPGDADELSASEVPEEVVASSGILHVNGRHFDACIAAAKKAREHNVLVSFDGGSHRFRGDMVELVRLTDVCIVARQFACAFSGETDIPASAAKCLQEGPSIVVITDGTEGSWVFEKSGGYFHQPAFQLEKVADTTGAGDAYHGGFLFGLSRRYSLPSCALLASAVAAMSTQKLGGRSALPSFEEALSFLSGKGFSL